ncbi:MAG: SpaA isopeptide-forming pilin-related protein [Monoglobales bacterium]
MNGLPEKAKVYEVTEKVTEKEEQVVIGSKRVEKTDDNGNVIYRIAEGGEYKLDADGNKILKRDENGEIQYSDKPLSQTVTAVNRLNSYLTSIERQEPSDPDLESSEVIDPDYILGETSSALVTSGYKSGLTDAPWKIVTLSGSTNGEVIEEILTECASDSFWDAYDVESVFEKDGTWYAKIRYAYKALKNQPVIYEQGTGRLVLRNTCDGGYYYTVYEESEYEKNGYRFTVAKKELDQAALETGEIQLKTVVAPLYEQYDTGEYLLDGNGQKIPVMETVPEYGTQVVVEQKETLTTVPVSCHEESGRLVAHVDTVDVDFSDEAYVTRRYRVVTEDRITGYPNATVNVTTQKAELDEGSYVKYVLLLYPGQYEIYEDDGTREKPVQVLERVIKQAIKVTKDIALDSYEHNTYEIHRDPFTVLFGGYNGKQETKTLPGFFFKLYLRSDLEETGLLEKKEDGSFDYERFFKENSSYETSLALEWDVEKYDADQDMTTVHANRGGGKDDYWGQSRMMPYGVYVLVEQQPTGIPQKAYAIDSPKEVEIPFIPQVDEDGTVHDKVPSTEYLYDSTMTPEELTERYRIRFNEESHVIYAHNNDGDFEVFKYGLEPDISRDCQNETVAGYYHYSSISEDAGKQDGVYYETYYDRDGNLTDYGVTLDDVDTMTGKSTAVDRKFAKALIPWSVLDPRYGEVINDDGDVGNRDAGLEEDGTFNFVAFSNTDFENELYSSRLRIEKLDSETGENILHDGALFKIYAAKRDISGDGADGVTGSGDVLFDENGIPLYDESEQIFTQDDSGAEVGIFKAYTTVRDGEVTGSDGSIHTEKQCVGYLETYQPLGAGAYVLVEVMAPEGYVKSKPIAFTVYSDKVEYYEEGDQNKKVQAVKYQYMRPVGSDGKTVEEDMHQIVVKDKPIHIEIHKIENPKETVTYRVEGDEAQLKARGDVELQYKLNGEFAGFGFVTRTLRDDSEPEYVENATLTLYEGLEVKRTGEHSYEGVEVKRNLFDSVISIRATETGVDTDIRKTGTDSTKRDEWDITEVKNPPVALWYFDLDYDPTEFDEETGILYGLDDWGNRICMLDSETGMAYVTDESGAIIVWPLDEYGDKIISQSVEVYTDENGNPAINMDLQPVTDENGLPIYYKDGGVTWLENEWVTDDNGAFEIARVRQGAYILEETAAPLADGYVQSVAIGIRVKDVSEMQSFYMEDDYTKLEVSKLDMTSREEIEGATLTLYEAYRVYDDSDRGWHLEILLDMDDEPIVAETWVSEGGKPHWIDHIMPGDYILRETRVPTAAGYVTSEDVEVVIKETGEVQGFVMEDDHTAMEVLKVDSETGKTLDNDHRATLALYQAVVNVEGEVQYDENGIPLYDENRKIHQWQTDDGSAVRETAHQVPIEGGHTYTAYDYDIQGIPGTEQAVCYVTETGAMRFEYLPVGKYVLVEEQAPSGYTKADPLYVPILDIGKNGRVQQFTMEDKPIRVLLTKVNVTGGKEIAGATIAIYRAAEEGTLVKHQMKDEAGNLLYVTDQDGNLLTDEAGNLIPAMEYDEAYLVERWISGSDGQYSKKDLENGVIPEGYEVGDLRLHEMKEPKAGLYYFVEEQPPFGYVRAAELPFEVVDTMVIQKIELVNELIQGQLEIVKADKAEAEKLLGGAKFKFTNQDTNVTTILITDEEGRAVSSLIPIGTVGTDGAVSLYHFSVQEVDAPDGYFLDPTVHEFQFNVNTDRCAKLVYRYDAKDEKNKVLISKKILTTKEELPGAKLEIRPVTEITDDSGQIVKQEGEVIESWISTDKPYEIEGLMPGEYVLIETRAPEGYLEAEKVYFTVKENMTVEEIPLVEMFDDDTKTEIIKVDEETKEPLAGVKLKLLREDSMEVVKEWVTDETGSIQLMGLPAGNYLLQEVEAPEGYQLPDEPMRITIVKDFKLQTFMVNNRKIEVQIEKRDLENREFVEGAVLRLLDEQAKVAAQWTTKKEPEIFTGIKAGIYTLEEVQAPEGYLLMKEPMELEIKNQSGIQTFTVLNQKLEVDILKKDKESGELLSGANLRLIRNSDGTVIREWISGGVAEVFKGLAPGSYVLEEVAAPSGYATAEKLVFEVTGTEEKQEVVLNNEKIVTDYEKTDGVTGEAVTGASLQLIQNAGTKEEKVITSWISDGKPMRLTGIPAGTYVIRELAAPAGYVPMKDMVIEIVPDQVSQHFMVKNQPIQAEIEKTGDSSGTLLGGAVLQLVRNTDGRIIREWVSKADQVEHFSKLEPGSYTIREVKAPSGYKKMDPKVIEIKAVEEIQEFVVRNYKITHTGGGGGGGDRPKPDTEYMELYKVDGTTGERLSGAVITVYHPDGSVYFEGTTGPSGTVRFKKPGTGQYTFAETKEPDGYFRNEDVFTFVIQPNGSVSGDTEIMDYKKPEMIISKEDVTTSEELPGAEIEITDKNGNQIFTGISDENGKVYFEVPKPGEYHFKEITAPEGYDRNETVFSFTVFEDGTIIGDHTITDQKHYGRITASYETERKGDGDVTIGELIHAPKTGDSSRLGLIFLCWLASVGGLVLFIFWNWQSKRKAGFGKRTGSKLGVFLIICMMAAGTPAMKVQAAEDVLENLYEEHQYTTDNPDSDEAEKLFEKELERDGITYRLSEIRTEVVKEKGGSSRDTLELTTSPFLEEVAEKQKPQEQIVQDGVTYQLVSSELEAYKIPAHEIPVKKEVLYEAVESKDVIPSKIKVTVTDEATGQTMETIAELSDQRVGEQYWSEDFSFPVTFHEYGLDGYWLGEQVFKLNGDVPDFTGYETELLQLIDVNQEDYTVEAASWNGESYRNADGILCRDVTVTGKKLVSDCTVTYEGSAAFSEADGVRYCSTYQNAEGSSGAETAYTMKATGVYVPKKGNLAAAAAVVGITAAGAGTVGIVYYRKKKQGSRA